MAAAELFLRGGDQGGRVFKVWSGSWARSKGSRLMVGQDGWGSWLAGLSGGGAESLDLHQQPSTKTRYPRSLVLMARRLVVCQSRKMNLFLLYLYHYNMLTYSKLKIE